MTLEYRIAGIVYNWKNKVRDNENVPSANRGEWSVQVPIYFYIFVRQKT